jgi:hypothetical protein
MEPAMKGFTLLVIVMLAGTSEARAQTLTASHRAALADSLKSFANSLVVAISNHDVEKFMAAHAESPELTYAAAGMIYPTKDSLHHELTRYFASPAAANVHFTLGSAKVNVLDANNGVVTGWIDSSNVDAQGKPRKGHQAWSIVVQRRGRDWKIVQAHESYPRTPAP